MYNMDDSLSIDELAGVPSFTWPAVSPSGSLLAFYRERDGHCELSILDRATGTTTPIPSERSFLCC